MKSCFRTSYSTAISSGAIARMQNVALASSLASWPTAIDDMPEEEKTAGELVSFNFLSLMSARMPLGDVYRMRLRAPSARGVSIVVQGEVSNLADSPHPANFDALYEDFEVENEILRIMMWAQASLVEVILFSDKLNVLLEKLEGCLDTSGC